MSDNSSLKLLEYVEERLDKERVKKNIEILDIVKNIIKSKFESNNLVYKSNSDL